jgi:nicotinamidase/pyrazinamidase
MIKLDRSCALIIVDIQNDFMPSGALPVPEADKVIPVLNKYVDIFIAKKLPIFVTRDWHPPDHKSFKKYGGEWPVHCVKGSVGAQFHKDLKIPVDAIVISKATEPDDDTYSEFEGTELSKILAQKGARCLFIGGVATDYCVKETALDAIREGFDTVLLQDAVKGISRSDDAIKEMRNRGVKVASIDDIA